MSFRVSIQWRRDFRQRRRMTGKKENTRSPRTIRCPVAARLIGRTVHIADSRLSLVYREQYVFLLELPVGLTGERILRNFREIGRLHQIIQGLRRPLLIQSELRNHRTQREQVLPQHGFFGAQDRLVVKRDRDRDEDQHDADHDHHFDQRKAAALPVFWETYHSLYLVPSSAVPSDLVNTSKTLCPPQESEVGSSCIDRIPHSAFPVMGSTGILRRKRTFLPPTSTPVTSVSRSAGYPSVPTLIWK